MEKRQWVITTRTALLLLAVAFTVLVTPTKAWADNVNYFNPTADEGEQTKTANATKMTSASQELASGWYYVDGEVTIEDRISMTDASGEVNLILADGCELNAKKGIRVAGGQTLNIYAQSAGEGCGALHASANGNAAIGGDAGGDGEPDGTDGESAGTITIYGGRILADGQGVIGGGNGGFGSEVVGDGGHGGTITIWGGIVAASRLGDGADGYGDCYTGSGTIVLSWSSNSDRITVWNECHCQVTLQKDFVDAQYGGAYFAGEYNGIPSVDLVPANAVLAITPKAPTCTEKGYQRVCWFKYATQLYYSDEACTEGNELDSWDVEIPALGHFFDHVDATPATLATSGSLEGYRCQRCGRCFEDEYGMDELDDLAYQIGGNADDGYYMLMPATNTRVLELDNSVASVKVYDNGGETGNYSDYCDGKLVLTAPKGYLIQLTGTVVAEPYCDHLTVYKDDPTDGDVLLNELMCEYDVEGIVIPASIGTLMASSMTLHFYSDGSKNYAGLDLTATLIDATPNTITIAEATGGEVTGPETAIISDVVTLTATPSGDYLLSGITVKNNVTEEEIEVTGGTWYDNTATFIMPGAPVTVTPTFTSDKTNLSINMPWTGTLTATIPSDVTSLKIYDDGGEGGSETTSDEEGNYSDSCDGYLVLTAPDGYAVQLTGTVVLEPRYDYLTVYAGTTTDGPTLLEQKWSDGKDEDDGDGNTITKPILTSIEPLTASSMMLYLSSDGGDNYAGIDLTATLVKATPYTITIAEATGGEVTGPAIASMGDVVTLTATPDGDNLLSGITVKNNTTEEEVAVTGGTWYNNTATFAMPGAPVTITPTFTSDKDNLSINIPRTGTLTVTIPSDVTSLKIYDDGGAENNHSDGCNGKLVLIAPDNMQISLTGNVTTGGYSGGLSAYAGTTTEGDQLLYQKGSEIDGEPVGIGTVVAPSLLLVFDSYSGQSFAGLDLTATIEEETGVIIGYDDCGDPIACIDDMSADEVKIESDIVVDRVILKRQFTPGQTSTLMLPFDIDVNNIGAAIYTFSGVAYDEGVDKWTATMTQVEDGQIAANTPFMLQSYDWELELYTYGQTMNTTTNTRQDTQGDWTLTGVYQKKEWTAGECGNDYGFAANSGTATDGVTYVEGGDFVQVAAGAYVNPMRAYLTYTGSDNPFTLARRSERASLPQRISVVLVRADGQTTEIGTLTPAFDEGEGVWYSLDGVRQNGKPQRKGLYIRNGKKVVVK